MAMNDEELGGGKRRGAGALRGKRSEEDWKRLGVEFKASGLSARAFGQPRGVAPRTLLSRATRILRGQQLPGTNRFVLPLIHAGFRPIFE